LLASAHECIALEENGVMKYQGPSSDEVILVESAMNLRFAFITSTRDKIKVKNKIIRIK
jgi:hypothetical protein